MRVRTDMQIQEKGLAILDEAVGVLQIRLSFANGFDFGSAQGYAGLEFFKQEVVVAGDAVVGGGALAESHRIARPSLFWRPGAIGRYDSVAGLACHRGKSLKLSS